jgi:hypothetical protein
MKRGLVDTAIVDHFLTTELKNMDFIDASDHTQIKSWLESLCDNTPTRYEKALIAKEIWKFFTEKSLRAITDNLRGYKELRHYFDEYVEYEDLLFSLDKSYRDHTIHAGWVMLLGFYLRNICDLFKNLKEYPVKNLDGDDSDCQRTIEIIKESESPLWCLIALTHDLGYPIEKTRNANAILNKMIGNFGVLRQRDFDYNFTIVHQTAINELLNTISSLVVWRKGGFQVGIRSGARLDYAKSFERLNHGVMSAFLLQSYLDWICDTMDILRGVERFGDREHKSAAMKGIVITLVSAIATHTARYKYASNLNTMTSLLLISDELEEFSRYSRSSATHDWVNVKCKTEFQWEETSFGINYTFDTPDVDYNIKLFFRGKVSKLHSFFELRSSKIKKISITCSDVRKAEPLEIKYEKTLSGARVMHPKSSGKWEECRE